MTSEHGMACDYCGVDWPAGVGMAPHTHSGVDIALVRGSALYAAAAGHGAFAAFDARYYRPYHVDIITGDGQHPIYAHKWSIDPSVFQGGRVERGQYLATSGEQTDPGTMQPDGTGAHLHFEARTLEGSGERAIDPEPLLAQASGGSFCQPSAPPNFDGQQHRVNDIVFHPYWRTIEAAVDGLGCHQWADPSSCATCDPFATG